MRDLSLVEPISLSSPDHIIDTTITGVHTSTWAILTAIKRRLISDVSIVELLVRDRRHKLVITAMFPTTIVPRLASITIASTNTQ